MKAKKMIALVAVLAVLVTCLIPAGVLATNSIPETAREWIEPLTHDSRYRVGGDASDLTELPHTEEAWPSEAPADLNVSYIWSHSVFKAYLDSELEYDNMMVWVSDEWCQRVPQNVNGLGLVNVTGTGEVTSEFRVNCPKYMYVAYFKDDDMLPFAVYCEQMLPVAATLEEVRVRTPQEEPAGGYPVTEEVVVEPVWTVGTTDGSKGGGDFTPVPGLHGWPNLAAIRWGIKGEPEDVPAIQGSSNLVAVTDDSRYWALVPPYNGGDVTYTATLTTTTHVADEDYYFVFPEEPAEITIHWDASAGPLPTVTPAPTSTPRPEPTEEPHPDEGWLAPTISRLDYYAGGPQNNMTEMPSTEAEWPAEAPDLETQYAWVLSSPVPHASMSDSFDHIQLFMSRSWCPKLPTPDNRIGYGFQDVTNNAAHGWGFSLTAPTYVYLMGFDEPGDIPSAVYCARIQTVAASVTDIGYAYPDEVPEEGFPLTDLVALKPIWTVGATSGAAGAPDFTPIEGLSGYPAGASVRWAMQDGSGTVVEGGNTTAGGTPATLLPPEGGGERTYTATAVSAGGSQSTINNFNLASKNPPASIQVPWKSDKELTEPPFENVPGSGLEVSVVPSPNGTGAILTGLPLHSSTAATTVGEFTAALRVPDGMRIIVRGSEGEVLDTKSAISTGCVVDVADARGNVVYSVPVAIRGDVLGTGVMSMSQLVRAAAAYVGREPLEGLFLDAACMVSDSSKVTLTSLVLLADMLRGTEI